MVDKKTTLALFLGNRGMFPGELQVEARKMVVERLEELGFGWIVLDEDATKFGAVETLEEGQIYADFLAKNKGKFDGIIVLLPNFGDENGAAAALKDAGVPILVLALPDELDKMAPALRRDAFCGKFSICDVLRQFRIQYSVLKPHVVSPEDPRFNENISFFAMVCRVVKAMRGLRIGAIGSRTTAFKTVRFDEITLQAHGITVEAFDLSDVFARMEKCDPQDAEYQNKAAVLLEYTHWGETPPEAMDRLVRLALVLDAIVVENQLGAVAIRCWTEMQEILGISPCVLLSEMNDRGIVAACEVDVCNAVAMVALQAATGLPTTCLDWNNNHGTEDDKCQLFHCGPVPASMMLGPGLVTDHAILRNLATVDCSHGCNTGRIKPTDMTFASLNTEGGRMIFYIGEGKFTDDKVPEDSFGCAGVAEISDLQDVLLYLCEHGFRHHVAVGEGHVLEAVAHAFSVYLGYESVVRVTD